MQAPQLSVPRAHFPELPMDSPVRSLHSVSWTFLSPQPAGSQGWSISCQGSRLSAGMTGPRRGDKMHTWNVTVFPKPQLCDRSRRTLIIAEALDAWCFSCSEWKLPQTRARRGAGIGGITLAWQGWCLCWLEASWPAEPDTAPPPAQGLTAYHDISLDKCYVIELNTTIVLPPRNFWELLMNVKTYIIQEEMVVTEHVSDKEALGSFIYHLCSGKDTYRLRRRATRRRINKRGAKNCNAIRHFENTFVVETLICGVV
uniref:Integral membrane protein 2 n=1 Tax=Ursus maritimus TaxID=29073 RepID=A0A452UR32_URSMA